MQVTGKLGAIGAAMIAVVAGAARVEAGCGCLKPPPPVAAIRPPFASPGSPVTLIAEGLVVGASYRVTFHGWNAEGATGEEATADGIAVSKRDFADGVVKTQVVVAMPELEPGPAAVVMTPLVGGDALLEAPADDFTVLQAALPLQETKGQTTARCYRAAVGMDGTVFFPLDIADVADRMIFAGRAGGYRLAFDADDVVIYNTQGVTMQLLDPNVVGLYTIDDAPDAAANAPDDKEWGASGRSFRMTYDRHEFLTYRELHETDPNYAHDPNDPDWHVDGTRHYDHDHLVLAVAGLIDGAIVPEAGVTPPFTFRVKTTPGLPTGPSVLTEIQWSEDCESEPEPEPLDEVPAPACGEEPFQGCRRSVGSGRSLLKIDDVENDARDALVWKWKYGQDTALGNFGDPAAADGLALCLYDESGETPALVFGAGIPPNAGCDLPGDRSCWMVTGRSESPRGLVYKNREGLPDGVAGATLKPGRDHRAQIVIAGRGEELELPPLPSALPLRAQLQSATGQCWESRFGPDGVRKNTASRLRARAE